MMYRYPHNSDLIGQTQELVGAAGRRGLSKTWGFLLRSLLVFGQTEWLQKAKFWWMFFLTTNSWENMGKRDDWDGHQFHYPFHGTHCFNGYSMNIYKDSHIWLFHALNDLNDLFWMSNLMMQDDSDVSWLFIDPIRIFHSCGQKWWSALYTTVFVLI